MSVEKFGRNKDVDNPEVEDIWDGGGTYTFTTTAQTYYVSSSDNSDTQSTGFEVLTEDSDGNWNGEVFTQDIAGQTKTALAPPSGNPVIRINRFWNDGGSDYAGDVYVYEDDTVVAGVPQTATKIRAKILIGNNQTLMAIYTVPSTNKSIFIKSYYWSILKRTAASANVELLTRKYGKVFRVKHVTGGNQAGTSKDAHKFENGIRVESKTDIKVRADVTVVDVDMAAGFFVDFEQK